MTLEPYHPVQSPMTEPLLPLVKTPTTVASVHDLEHIDPVPVLAVALGGETAPQLLARLTSGLDAHVAGRLSDDLAVVLIRHAAEDLPVAGITGEGRSIPAGPDAPVTASEPAVVAPAVAAPMPATAQAGRDHDPDRSADARI